MKNAMSKRLTALCLALCLALPLAGCSGKEESSAANRLEAIKERGYIEVVTEPYFAPMEFIDPTKEGDEKYVGADIELAHHIADELGVECHIIPLDFTSVLSGVTTGKYDMAISALAYTPERAGGHGAFGRLLLRHRRYRLWSDGTHRGPGCHHFGGRPRR